MLKRLFLSLAVPLCTSIVTPKPVTQTSTVPPTLLASMSTNVEPCKDFYQFSCGNWKATHPTPRGLGTYTAGDAAQHQLFENIRQLFVSPPTGASKSFSLAKTFYESCVDNIVLIKQGLEPLKTLIKPFQGINWKDIVARTKNVAVSHGYGCSSFFPPKLITSMESLHFSLRLQKRGYLLMIMKIQT